MWNIWSWACISWRHVPSEAEFEILETTLNWWTCRNGNTRECGWLWWQYHSTTNALSSIPEILQLPLSGIGTSTPNFVRGSNTVLWSSTSVAVSWPWFSYDGAYTREFSYSQFKVLRGRPNQTYRNSVRCIKD